MDIELRIPAVLDIPVVVPPDIVAAGTLDIVVASVVAAGLVAYESLVVDNLHLAWPRPLQVHLAAIQVLASMDIPACVSQVIHTDSAMTVDTPNSHDRDYTDSTPVHHSSYDSVSMHSVSVLVPSHSNLVLGIRFPSV